MCMLLFSCQEGETVLISAARDGHLEVVRTLLSKYADVEAADVVSSLRSMHVTSNQSDTNAVTFFFGFAAFSMAVLLPVSSLWNKRKEAELTVIYLLKHFISTSRGFGKHLCVISIECVCLVFQPYINSFRAV